MAINVTAVTPPTILVNGTAVSAKEVQTGEKSFRGHRDSFSGQDSITTVTGPATITFTGPAGAEIRYTFNSKRVSLGSKKYYGDKPVILRSNGNGFGSDNTTIRAKSFLNGESSATTEVVVRILTAPAGAGSNDTTANRGDGQKTSQTGM